MEVLSKEFDTLYWPLYNSFVNFLFGRRNSHALVRFDNLF